MEDSIQIYYKLGQIEAGIQSIHEKVDELAKNLDKRLDDQNKRLTVIEDRVDKHDNHKWFISGIAAAVAAAVSFLLKVLT